MLHDVDVLQLDDTSSTATDWRPLLMGEIAREAQEAVDAIAGAIGSDATGLQDASLAGGHAGIALLFAYLSQTYGQRNAAQQARAHLSQAIDAVAIRPMRASLYSGFTGIAWTASHVQSMLFDPAAEDPNTEIDNILLSYLQQELWHRDYDLIGGLVGYGVYALERLPRPTAMACLERIIAHLAATARDEEGGVTWWTDPRWLPPQTRQEYPHGYFNLGLAHGVPGIIALLGGAYLAGVARSTVRQLLSGAVHWLLMQQLPANERSIFGHWAGSNIAPQPSRLAWCYGDLGIAAALLCAARCLDEPAWAWAATEIAQTAAVRPSELAGVVDAGLCHGSAGVAHLFNRLYQATGDAILADAARFWFERTLAFRHPSHGVGGYLAWEQTSGRTMDMEWASDPGFLCGATGIALALHSATTSITPHWDRVLLVSVPPRR